ncbi:tetratricopeptide repeat protein [Crocinitomix catalasitica]|nr:tetratricopeptide repeat protein [Crocinitomix catalasitica]
MSSKTPVITQIQWISVIPQVVILAGLIFAFRELDNQTGIIVGAAIYLLISVSVRTMLTANHRTGIRLVKKKKFKEAIKEFESSYNYFKKKNWIDKFRSITLLSPSRISYSEMALNNIAFCYGQLGNGKKALEYYEKTLKRFPESVLAITGIQMLKSMTNEEE